MCCDMLGVDGSSLKMVKLKPTTPNMLQHRAWPDACNMLRPTLCSAICCVDRTACCNCLRTDCIVNLTLCTCKRSLQYQFLSNIWNFYNSINCKPPHLVFSEFDYPFIPKCSFKTSEKRGNVAILSITPSHCTQMQSDHSICIGILVELSLCHNKFRFRL